MLVDTAWGELLTLGLLTVIENRVGRPVVRAIVTHLHYDRLAGADRLEQNVQAVADVVGKHDAVP